jgi:hypothetical protein
MPSTTRLLADWTCGPTISLFDPPTYVVASLGDALTSFRHGEGSLGETRPRESRPSTAAAQQGLGQDDP